MIRKGRGVSGPTLLANLQLSDPFTDQRSTRARPVSSGKVGQRPSHKLLYCQRSIEPLTESCGRENKMQLHRRCHLQVERLEPRTLLTTFIVSHNGDSGAGSLRQAILAANAADGKDVITFHIGTGLQTIAPTTELPQITDAVILDGTIQPGYAGKPLIALIPATPIGIGLSINSGGCSIKSLIISGWQRGIDLSAGGGNTITNCYIGTDATGTIAKP